VHWPVDNPFIYTLPVPTIGVFTGFGKLKGCVPLGLPALQVQWPGLQPSSPITDITGSLTSRPLSLQMHGPSIVSHFFLPFSSRLTFQQICVPCSSCSALELSILSRYWAQQFHFCTFTFLQPLHHTVRHQYEVWLQTTFGLVNSYTL
jgi:hypothetical protein